MKELSNVQEKTIADYVSAAYPSVAVNTNEEDRFLMEVVRLAKEIEGEAALISASNILYTVSIDKKKNVLVKTPLELKSSYAHAFRYAASKQNTLLVALDYQHVVRNGAGYRTLKDQFDMLKSIRSCIIIVAPHWSLPTELQHDIPTLDFKLPTQEELGQALDIAVESFIQEAINTNPALKARAESRRPDLPTRNAALNAAAGLSRSEAENAFSLSFVRRSRIDPEVINEEKMNFIRASGLLTIEPPPPIVPGGLGQWKDFCKYELVPVLGHPLLGVRGVLLIGMPGAGKTLSARSLGAMLGCPVLGMDIGALKAKGDAKLGAFEGNVMAALAQVEAVGQSVLFIDEVEKGVGGHQSSARTDGGTTLGVIGNILKWMDQQRSALVLMTCNDYSLLPPPLVRSGRIDAQFFVDMPNILERPEIAQIHLKRYAGIDDSKLITFISDITDGWTGAEIEQLVVASSRRGFKNGEIKLTQDIIEVASKGIKPISILRKEEIDHLRAESIDKFRLANTLLKAKETTTGHRAIRVRETVEK